MNITNQAAERDQAIERVAANSVLWQALARIALRNVAVRQTDLTSDDIWWELVYHKVASPIEPRVMGPVMLRGTSEGWISRTNTTRIAAHPATPNHKRPQTIYRSRIMDGEPFAWPTVKPSQEAFPW